ncbi:VanZ family protein [Flaviaesturariibacter amylovorans]|uniref:VanZ-like domain-containing protein n=1 Tax=Flaviaesturariibacter amylovorans TaxID=1084520 RepID=A0ABP8GWF3_9BACT
MIRSLPLNVRWRLRTRALIALLFGAYLGALTGLFVIKDPAFFLQQCSELNWDQLGQYTRYANYIPGRTLAYYGTLQENFGTGVRNVGANLFGFLPFGFLLPLLNDRYRHAGRLARAAMLLSATFEVFQLLTGVGSFDVDDLLLNSAGAVLGFFALEWLSARRERAPYRAASFR